MPTTSFKNFRHETSVRSRNPQNESPRRMLAGYQKISKVVTRECLHRGPGRVSSGFPIEALGNDKLLEVGKKLLRSEL
jgi:hypothetical protein